MESSSFIDLNNTVITKVDDYIHPLSTLNLNNADDQNSLSLYSEEYITKKINDDIKSFWHLYREWWLYFYTIFILGDKEEKEEVAARFNGLLTDELAEFIHIEFTVDVVNCTVYPGTIVNKVIYSSKDIVEIYISPRMNRNNISVLDKFVNYYYENRANIDEYNTEKNKELKIDVDKCRQCTKILKYKAFNLHLPLFDKVEVEDVNNNVKLIKHSDFLAQASIKTYDDVYKLDILIAVKDKVIKYVMKQVQVDDELILEPNDTIIIDSIILNLVGEYNLMHYVNSIKYVSLKDTKVSEYYEISYLRKIIESINTLNKHDSCHTCGRTKLQSKLYLCSKCKRVYYCDTLCRGIDRPIHKKICDL